MPHFRSIRLPFIAALLAATLHAQTHRVDAPEKVIRSIGVYEWTGELAKPNAARLVPVSLFIDAAYQDGGSYYARPVPLALLNGNIYSLEKAGVPQGTITLDYARHLQSSVAGAEDTTTLGWFGYGTFATMPEPRKSPVLHASANPPAIVSSKDSDRPTFSNRSHDNSKSTPATSSTPDKTPAATTTAPADDDPDRPHLGKAPAAKTTPAPDPSDPSPPATTSGTQKTNEGQNTNPTITRNPVEDDKDRPTLRHRDPKQAEAERKARDRSGVIATPGSLNDDPDRPNMRRGRTAGIGGAPSAQLSGMPAELHQMVAVSDPANREPHPFARDWASPTERADILAKMQTIAREQLADYVRHNFAEQNPTPAPTKPTTKTRTRQPAASHVPPVPAAPLTGEQIASYSLSYGGLPTFVYSAVSPGPTHPPVAMTPNIPAPERYVTVVAQQLPSGELQAAFSSVTDVAHLDRTPWFRLIDAVDPDAEHRASLLFELRGHSSRQFALYRILSAKAEQIFITNPTD
jgi:hypothetical protein